MPSIIRKIKKAMPEIVRKANEEQRKILENHYARFIARPLTPEAARKLLRVGSVVVRKCVHDKNPKWKMDKVGKRSIDLESMIYLVELGDRVILLER